MLKIEKFTDVFMTGGIMHTPSHINVCKFYNFQLTFSQLIFHLNISPEIRNLGRITKFKMLFLVLVFVFNFDLFKFSAATLEKGLLMRGHHLAFINKERDNAPLKCTQKYQLRSFAFPLFVIAILANKLVKIGRWRFWRGKIGP